MKEEAPIPVSVSLGNAPGGKSKLIPREKDKPRVLFISLIAIGLAALVSVVAKSLIYLISLVTNISFYGNFTFQESRPSDKHLGIWVILVPAIGGLIVGLMAAFGSKAIRGHGIPEAMEQILTNKSRINPAITYLKPISSAISIGTGGPFGAEGPIIATGGALGSTIGQLLKITHHERKVLLAAGATAGMAAIFGSPIAGMFLAIELLLFEFSPRSLIPVSLACISGAAGHHIFFGDGPVFPMGAINIDITNNALAAYSIIGILTGLASVAVTKIVYFIEDGFEKLPINWMWWPAIGGLAVGVIGYFGPRTLGVGYYNITELLSGTLALNVVISLCILKFISWAISLGSGTSGGTLAPLLTIGGATGVLLGVAGSALAPKAGINIPMAALVGMAAMFAGASRAFITSIVFALETTGQFRGLLPLLAGCSGSYIVSYFLMENTIMTEKISRRGVKTPVSYEPDVFEKTTIAEVMDPNGIVLSDENTIDEAVDWLESDPERKTNFFIISSTEGEYRGILSASNLYSAHHNGSAKIGSLLKRRPESIGVNETLRRAAEIMARENVDVLPVLSDDNRIIAVVSYLDLLSSYRKRAEEHAEAKSVINLKSKALKLLVHGKKISSGKA